jgi:hypothetical protein
MTILFLVFGFESYLYLLMVIPFFFYSSLPNGLVIGRRWFVLLVVNCVFYDWVLVFVYVFDVNVFGLCEVMPR